MFASFATELQRSITSLATGPLICVPFGFPLSSFRIATALSSKETLSPFGLLYGFLTLMIIASKTFPFISGIPLLTLTLTKSAIFAKPCLPFAAFNLFAETILTILAPLLSAAITFAPRFNALVALAVIAFILFFFLRAFYLFNDCEMNYLAQGSTFLHFYQISDMDLIFHAHREMRVNFCFSLHVSLIFSYVNHSLEFNNNSLREFLYYPSFKSSS